MTAAILAKVARFCQLFLVFFEFLFKKWNLLARMTFDGSVTSDDATYVIFKYFQNFPQNQGKAQIGSRIRGAWSPCPSAPRGPGFQLRNFLDSKKTPKKLHFLKLNSKKTPKKLQKLQKKLPKKFRQIQPKSKKTPKTAFSEIFSNPKKLQKNSIKTQKKLQKNSKKSFLRNLPESKQNPKKLSKHRFQKFSRIQKKSKKNPSKIHFFVT